MYKQECVVSVIEHGVRVRLRGHLRLYDCIDQLSTALLDQDIEVLRVADSKKKLYICDSFILFRNEYLFRSNDIRTRNTLTLQSFSKEWTKNKGMTNYDDK